MSGRMPIKMVKIAVSRKKVKQYEKKITDKYKRK